ncbi:MAG: 2,3-bisphosphoglycerate-dependent phosphoglycerate mutase [Acidimicrobiaceae bacterium]
MDVPLSAAGREQAAALGRWLVDQGRQRPTVAVASPYVRAQQTARIALDTAGLTDLELVVDERLREREFGVLDRLTKLGIEQRFPEEAEARRRVGKFYHRPPGGESWCDVALRVRSAMDSLTREHGGERLFLVAHQVVILMFRYVLDRMSEEEILAIDRETQLANCSVTTYRCDRGRNPDGMHLVHFNETTHLMDAGAPVTAEPDAPVPSADTSSNGRPH